MFLVSMRQETSVHALDTESKWCSAALFDNPGDANIFCDGIKRDLYGSETKIDEIEGNVYKIAQNLPKIQCSAIWVNDGKKYEHQPVNIETGIVVCGQRHHNCFSTLHYSGIKYQHLDDGKRLIQGFLSSDNRFLDRREAGAVAFAAGQIEKENDHLYSEDIY